MKRLLPNISRRRVECGYCNTAWATCGCWNHWFCNQKKQFSESVHGKVSGNTNKAPSYCSMQKYSKIVHIIDGRQSRKCTLFKRNFKEAKEEENRFSWANPLVIETCDDRTLWLYCWEGFPHKGLNWGILKRREKWIRARTVHLKVKKNSNQKPKCGGWR